MNSNEDEMLNSIRILLKKKKEKKISVERLNPRKTANYKEFSQTIRVNTGSR